LDANRVANRQGSHPARDRLDDGCVELGQHARIIFARIVVGQVRPQTGHALSALPAAAAAFVVFYWLESPISLTLGIFVFGLLKASVPALVVALAQEVAPAGSAGTAAGVIMSLHYTAGVLAPLIAATLITATGDILTAMILATSGPLVFYSILITAARERRRQSLNQL